MAGIAAPTTDHALWSLQSQSMPPGTNTRTGASTWRCTECHGWDYVGANGAYGVAGSHYTGFSGVLGSTRSPESVFSLLKEDDAVVASPFPVPGRSESAVALCGSDL